MPQISINFNPGPIATGKKADRVTFTCSSSFGGILQKEADMLGTTRSELAFQFVLEGMQRTLGTIFMAEPHSDKKVSELLKR